MVSDLHSLDSSTLLQTSQLRTQTIDLLNRLMADREQSERRIAEMGKRDPIKAVTGRTALDAAIASTREMIAAMDRLLIEANGELREAERASASSRMSSVANGEPYRAGRCHRNGSRAQQAVEVAGATP